MWGAHTHIMLDLNSNLGDPGCKPGALTVELGHYPRSFLAKVPLSACCSSEEANPG